MATGFATSVRESLLAARAFVGVGEASYATLAPTIIDDITPPEQQGPRARDLLPRDPARLGARLYARRLRSSKHWGWRTAFFVAGGPGIVLALTCLLIAEPERKLADGEGQDHRRLRTLAKIPLFRRAVLGYCAYTAAIGAFSYWAPTSSCIYAVPGPARLRRARTSGSGWSPSSPARSARSSAAGGPIAASAACRRPGRTRRTIRARTGSRINALLRVCAIGMVIAAPLTAVVFFMPTPTGFFACRVPRRDRAVPVDRAGQRDRPARGADRAARERDGRDDLRDPPVRRSVVAAAARRAAGRHRVLHAAPHDVTSTTIAMMALPLTFALSAYLWWPRRREAASVTDDTEPERPADAVAPARARHAARQVQADRGCSARAAWARCGPRTIRTSSAQVAVKLLRAEKAAPALRTRLLREARAMARLKHPNVLTVYEVGSDGDRDYIAMELVDGMNLDQWLATSPPREDAVARAARRRPRARRRASRRARPPRLQAAQRAALARRPRAGHRLRARARRRRRADPGGARVDDHADRARRHARCGQQGLGARLAADADRRADRHAGVHGARAVPRRAAGSAHRSVRVLRHRVAGAHRRAAVLGRHARRAAPRDQSRRRAPQDEAAAPRARRAAPRARSRSATAVGQPRRPARRARAGARRAALRGWRYAPPIFAFVAASLLFVASRREQPGDEAGVAVRVPAARGGVLRGVDERAPQHARGARRHRVGAGREHARRAAHELDQELRRERARRRRRLPRSRGSAACSASATRSRRSRGWPTR